MVHCLVGTSQPATECYHKRRTNLQISNELHSGDDTALEYCYLRRVQIPWKQKDMGSTWPSKLSSFTNALFFKVRRLSSGNVERFNARAIAGGTYQVHGENYVGKHPPVVSFTIVRVFLYLAMRSNLHMAQLDVKTAFLNGIMDEHMWTWSHCSVLDRPTRTSVLSKASHSLKQAQFVCHRRFCKDLANLWFQESLIASCFFRCIESNCRGDVFLPVHMNDTMLLTLWKENIEKVVLF